MPKINLRLTDEEHEALKMWAQESHRSIQREAIFRLFSERSLSERGSSLPDLDGSSTRRPDLAAIPRSESDHFKPDFK